MLKRLCAFPAALALLFWPVPAMAQDTSVDASTVTPTTAKPSSPVTLAARVAGMQHLQGFLPLDWDAKNGRLYLEIPKLGAELLYTNSLPYGTGSNDLGLDRGQTAPGHIVRFERQGNKILLIESNERLRTTATEPAERLATTQSFPESVLWGFKVEAASPEGGVLVDATEFYLQDAHGVSEALTRAQQGTYKVDASRSSIAIDTTKAFPLNTEVEAILTFTTEGAARGQYVRDVTPDPHALTLRERQSFVALPSPGFTPRRYDPRAGYFDLTYRDYNAPLGEDLDQRLIERHRLIKKDPSCRTDCEPVQPIVYYVDRGAPEPIRSALVEGARWWDQAFTAAGWHHAFQVEVLPEGADPMDIRYNIIQWVHRYTRGWSYGATVTDPRTGEILKGNVTLGSLRGRQDYLIAEALLAPYTTAGLRPSTKSSADPMLAMVLARIRQLSAHETGHTLGLAHNFAASSYAQSASVMDYPHPYITLGKGNVPDLSHAYAVNIGEWDKTAIKYGYRQFAPGTSAEAERTALDSLLVASEKSGMPYITDQDARPVGSAHPHAHLWDNGADPAMELDRILTLRAAALQRFGPDAIKAGTPMAQLENVLVPLYLLHRYQTEATAKLIGGLSYEYNLRGDGQPDPVIVSAEVQRRALAQVLRTLSPEVLTLPENLLKQLPPPPPGFPPTRESFASETGLTFDPVAAAESAADLTLALLFDSERASRLVQYHARDPRTPDFKEVVDAVMQTVARRSDRSDLGGVISRTIKFRTVEALLRLAATPTTSVEVRNLVRQQLAALKAEPPSSRNGSAEEIALHQAITARIGEFEHDPARFTPAKPIDAPPGMPIGMDDED